ncbi:hypothetical protein LOK49_LG12G00490 [Camellia lanceoleosa]|uniref:Uncharacterized protein n=1 Tax=Camellia lanceoleosa TaxID=1840588 RepID=A0ACC0FRE4_9ERIC|nr:hypothetical protein LOK49_LG12G00490 [Camellia lanceoleosa]
MGAREQHRDNGDSIFIGIRRRRGFSGQVPARQAPVHRPTLRHATQGLRPRSPQDGCPRSLRRHHRSHAIPSSSWTLSLCPLSGLRLGLMLRLMLMSIWLIILRLTSSS